MALFEKYGGLKKKDHEVMSAKEILIEGIEAQKKILSGGEHLNKTEYELNRSKKIWFKDGRFAPYIGQYLLFEDKSLDYPKGEELEVIKELEGAIAQHDKELFLSTRPVGAERAKQLGLATKIFPDSKTLSKDLHIELGFVLASAPGALEQAKFLHHQLGFKSPSDTLQFTAKALADRWETKEAQLGIDAFLNKEKPPWGK